MSVYMDQQPNAVCYENGMQHITDELLKLDLVIKRNLVFFNANIAERDPIMTQQAMFITKEEIDWQLKESSDDEVSDQHLQTLESQIEEKEKWIEQMCAQSEAQGINLPLVRLQRMFNLTAFEKQILVIVLAPELRRKYDRIYAYLQDDITRKRATVDLALQLLCDSETDRWRLHNLFSESSIMQHARIIHCIEDTQNPSGSSNLGQFLKLDEGILSYILGRQLLDDRIQEMARLESPYDTADILDRDAQLQSRINDLVDWRFKNRRTNHNLALYFQGPTGVGKKAMALAQCRRLKCGLLYFDAQCLSGSYNEIEHKLLIAFRESMLLGAPIYIAGVDQLFNDGTQGYLVANLIVRLIEEYGWLTFFGGEMAWPERVVLRNSRLQCIEFPLPNFWLRKQTWLNHLDYNDENERDDLATRLASQFQLTMAQIRSAADVVELTHHLKSEHSSTGAQEYIRACREQSNRRLGTLATKIDSQYHWEDIILPLRIHALLHQICDQVQQQHKVFDRWGFGARLSYGKGLSALFTGPPGTGKTLAAQVIANEIQLDLYKVDLSTVISKYIGETEKNLNRIFKEAESSNAILFFDEADALFGKRTDVNDAHDRYANIEVSYLLQKMEDYQGIVILASNFRGNMDDAFTRRIRFIIEFPFPDENSRAQIWRIHFPEQAPVDESIDHRSLAKQFPIPGGNIRNVILNAAFQAAKQDCPINMNHILESTRHEYEKIGKLWNADQYAHLTNNKQVG